MTRPIEWFDRAEKDINSSKLLYKNKDFGNAIFHLQQATEKIAKGYLLYLNLLKEPETNPKVTQYFKNLPSSITIPPAGGRDGYGHEWHEKFVDLINAMLHPYKDKLPAASFVAFSEITEKASKLSALADTQLIDWSINTTEQIVMLSKLRASDILKLAKSYGTEIDASNLEEIKKQSLAAAGLDKNTQIDENSVSLGKLFTLIGLLILNSVLSPHESLSRYPTDDIKINYDKNLPIIKKFAVFYEKINYFEEFLKKTVSDEV